MGIDMTDFKMIYQEQVFNVVNIIPEFEGHQEDAFRKPKFINAVYVDENGEIRSVHDEAWCFKFVRR
ncbi:hypothetical protein [Ruminiclostridium papyrosolvens]|uniref:Uncharacterized protein n=1 Tax=Ruminiclostridium papyrosolvens C7 TaxID=1330534 RepID=U4R2G0_9FIRM|nr:hypothetical protein [Ruminiclostridium papyrosolvens]EPR12482.1 hypothetical protein L323_07970 [Ruminiclostridium papyrosolvens C7]